MPDKTSSQVAREHRESLQKAVTAIERQNLDYALTILEQIILREPGFLEARQVLRAAQFKKHGSGGGFFRKVLGGASSSPLIAKGQLAMRKNPVEAMQIAEQILSSDPGSGLGNKMLAEAALGAGLPKTACFALEVARKGSPNDRDLTHKYAQALMAAGQVEKSEELYHQLIEDNPNDPELAMELKNVTAQRTLTQQGYEALASGTGSYRDILKDKDEAVALEQANRQVKSEDVAGRLIQEYTARLQREPGNMRLLRDIAELHTQKKDFEKALEAYAQIKASPVGNDPSLDKSIADTQMRRMDHLITQLDPAADDYPQQKAAIESERTDFQIQECRERANRYPSDLQIKYELGELYFKAGKITEAIQEFQKAQTNPNRRLHCVGYLGQCFARRGMHDMASRKFQEALREKAEFDEHKKELIYHLGCSLESMGKRTEAIDQFKLIYEIDIGYRDVAAKVDAFYSSGG
ncbi:MAG: tetratricopeptide repeat protein [Verrucomicrobia bacterium]|nr:tetratricopeptide repeat protein [Verrucomicrobiota bacterium]